MSSPLLQVEHLVKLYPVRKGVFGRVRDHVHAVDDVSLTVQRGETLGLVGESGGGKSTLCRAMLRLEDVTRGTVLLDGIDITRRGQRALRSVRRETQIVFQDPYSSLNPRRTVGQIVGEPLRLHRAASGSELRKSVRELLEMVGLGPEHHNRYPHEFSGGQRQRIGIARALALRPKLIVADEPVSALDTSIRAQVLNLLKDLQAQLGLTFVFVAHDLGVVRQVSDRIAVMYLGKIVERSPAEQLYRKPIHPYTVSLLSAIPLPDPKLNRTREALVLEGDVPSPIDPPPACRFHTRCPWATEICSQVEPPLRDFGDGHIAACHHPRNVSPAEAAAAQVASESPLSAGEPQEADKGLASARGGAR